MKCWKEAICAFFAQVEESKKTIKKHDTPKQDMNLKPAWGCFYVQVCSERVCNE
jgi:hypothetical protein